MSFAVLRPCCFDMWSPRRRRRHVTLRLLPISRATDADGRSEPTGGGMVRGGTPLGRIELHFPDEDASWLVSCLKKWWL